MFKINLFNAEEVKALNVLTSKKAGNIPALFLADKEKIARMLLGKYGSALGFINNNFIIDDDKITCNNVSVPTSPANYQDIENLHMFLTEAVIGYIHEYGLNTRFDMADFNSAFQRINQICYPLNRDMIHPDYFDKDINLEDNEYICAYCSAKFRSQTMPKPDKYGYVSCYHCDGNHAISQEYYHNGEPIMAYYCYKNHHFVANTTEYTCCVGHITYKIIPALNETSISFNPVMSYLHSEPADSYNFPEREVDLVETMKFVSFHNDTNLYVEITPDYAQAEPDNFFEQKNHYIYIRSGKYAVCYPYGIEKIIIPLNILPSDFNPKDNIFLIRAGIVFSHSNTNPYGNENKEQLYWSDGYKMQTFIPEHPDIRYGV